MLDRRSFLALSAVGAVVGVAGACAARSTQPEVDQTSEVSGVDVAIEPTETSIDMGGVTVRTWAYGGQVPGRSGTGQAGSAGNCLTTFPSRPTW